MPTGHIYQFKKFITIESAPDEEGITDYFYMSIVPAGEGYPPYEYFVMATFETREFMAKISASEISSLVQ